MARVDAFLHLMIDQKASDLHLVAGNLPILRVNGDLLRIKYRKISSSDCMAFMNEIMPTHARKIFDEQNDVDFSHLRSAS